MNSRSSIKTFARFLAVAQLHGTAVGRACTAASHSHQAIRGEDWIVIGQKTPSKNVEIRGSIITDRQSRNVLFTRRQHTDTPSNDQMTATFSLRRCVVPEATAAFPLPATVPTCFDWKLFWLY